MLSAEFYNSPEIEKDVPSIFLAGPTPRTEDERRNCSWRCDAVAHLIELQFDGIVYVPENNGPGTFEVYEDYPEWELQRIDKASVVVFWVPRCESMMQGFTTNVEFGMCVVRHGIKTLYGRPDGAYKTRYLDYIYRRKVERIPHVDLESLMKSACTMARQNHERRSPPCSIFDLGTWMPPGSRTIQNSITASGTPES